jgi:hypothetical protein
MLLQLTCGLEFDLALAPEIRPSNFSRAKSHGARRKENAGSEIGRLRWRWRKALPISPIERETLFTLQPLQSGCRERPAAILRVFIPGTLAITI